LVNLQISNNLGYFVKFYILKIKWKVRNWKSRNRIL